MPPPPPPTSPPHAPPTPPPKPPMRPTAGASATHATAETAVRFASEAAAMHTSAEAGLAAEGVLVDHATVVESAECAGVAAPLHVRRSESTIGSMVQVILVAI